MEPLGEGLVKSKVSDRPLSLVAPVAGRSKSLFTEKRVLRVCCLVPKSLVQLQAAAWAGSSSARRDPETAVGDF